MNIVFIGCVDFSLAILECVLDLKEANITGIITLRSSGFNSDFCSLGPTADHFRIPCLYADEIDQHEMTEWIYNLHPDVIYCFGWPRLLKKEVLSLPSIGVIGYHPTALPAHRGRHPIIWALALGLRETASTFFFMDEGADSGDILSMEKIPITEQDDAASLYRKLLCIAKGQIHSCTAQLASGLFPRVPQDHSKASYWRKRTEEDGEIDWRMSSRSIYNLVRALTHPYPGAHFFYNGKAIRVWKTQISEFFSVDLEGMEPGKIIRVDGRNFFVKCGDGIIKIIDHELQQIPMEGTYL